jgi:chromosome segregation ATPase
LNLFRGMSDNNPQPGIPDDSADINNYDIDEDFPDYANDQNKELNLIVKEKIQLIHHLNIEIEEHNERLKILQEHLRSVKQELIHTQALVDGKNAEIETEEHMKQIAERQAGRLKNELSKLEQRIADQQDRLNNIQNMIFKANEKMDQFKLEMNWNQEELEQWALATRQKEEDNLTLEKYRRADEAKIKELTLTIEKLTIEVSQKAQELEKEVTETQAAQIELDKTAEEFKRVHQERHKLYLQWTDAVVSSRKIEEQIAQIGEEYANARVYLQKKKEDYEASNQRLQREKENNKTLETEIVGEERIIAKTREDISNKDDNRHDLEGEVSILKNRLTSLATELAGRRANVAHINNELENKMERLDTAEKKYNMTKEKLEKESGAKDNLESANKGADTNFDEAKNMLGAVEKDIRLKKDELFKESEQLFKFREKQANLISDISGTLAATRNLNTNLNKLRSEKQRQKELLYDAEFNIQQMERKVAQAKGDRTQEEVKKFKKEIDEAQDELNKLKEHCKSLTRSNRQLIDELRTLDNTMALVKQDKDKLNTQIRELELENEMAVSDLEKIQKHKSDTLVQHDVMKLEIKKLKYTVNVESDKVFSLENRKYQLEMSMKEREEEIQVHKDILVSELKAAEEERHKVAKELQKRKVKVKNLRLKYEGLVQKNKSSSEDQESVGEHSQAYYVIKAAQDREELQRYGDELDGKIRKCEKEIKALENTMKHLQKRNKNYRDKFLRGAEGADLEKKQILEEQCRAASETLFKKRKEVQKLNKEYDDDMRRLMEIQTKQQNFLKKNDEVAQTRERIDKELGDQDEKLERAANTRNENFEALAQRYPDLEDTTSYKDVQFEAQQLRTKYLMNAIGILTSENGELHAILEQPFQELGLEIPQISERPGTGSSQRSGRSQGSGRSGM